MRAVFLASKQSIPAINKWTATLQSSGALIQHVTAWSGPGYLGRRQAGAACNVDPFLLGAGISLEAHLAECCRGEGLLLVSVDLGQQLLPRSGVVLLLWQPQVPQDVVQACAVLPPSLADGGCIRGLLLVDASPSLTQSVIHKVLEGAGLQGLARKPTVLALRTTQAPQAAVQALTQLSERLPPPPAAWGSPDLPIMSGGVRIAVARDDAFSPSFHENLALLHQAGAQLLFFSLLYDTSIPVGAACMYLSSGPLEAERWQQLANNRPLLSAVRAFCDAGGMVLAEGAGLLYLSRTVELDEDDGAHKHRSYEMAGVLPFKAHLLPEPQAATVELHVTAGNPLMPAGCRPRGYLSSQASIVAVEERPLQSLPLGLANRSPVQTPKGSTAAFSTTYEVSVMLPRELQQEQHQERQAQDKDMTDAESPRVATEPPMPEGYALHNVLASSCFLYLPSDPSLVLHILRRSACIDCAALAVAVAQNLACSAIPASKAHFQAALASVAGSRAGSRRQSIHDVSALAAAYGSNSGGSSATGMLGCSSGCGSCTNHHNHHLPSPHHQPSAMPAASLPASSLPCAAPSSCTGTVCGSHCPLSPLQYNNPLSQSSSTNAIASSLFPSDSRCGPVTALAPPAKDLGCSSSLSAADASGPSGRPHALPPARPGRSNGVPTGWRASHDSTAAPAGTLTRHHQQAGCGILAYGSAASLSCSTPVAVMHAIRPGKVPVCHDPHASAGPDAAHMPYQDPAARRAEAPCGFGNPSCSDQRPLAMERSSSCNSYGSLAHGPTVPATRSQGAMPHAISTPALGASDALYQSRLSRPRVHEDLGPDPASLGSPGPYGFGWNAGAPGLAGPGWATAASTTPTQSHGPVGFVGPFGVSRAHVHGGSVVCCAPGVCEALVAMGMANRLTGIGSDCDHPPDVCASRRTVFRWVVPEEVPHGAAARGIRVVWPCGASGSAAAANSATASSGGGLQAPAGVGGGGGRGSRASGDRCGGSRPGRVLLVDELTLRQAAPCVLVLPDVPELAAPERMQLEQALADTGLVDSPGGPCRILHVSCRTLVDVMDLLLEVGSVAGDPQAASMFLERLQARLRRIAAAAATAGAAQTSVAPSAAVSLLSSVPMPLSPPKSLKVLILQSLDPLVESGRWVPEMLALVGATACLALPGGDDVQLSWQDIRGRAAPDVLIILTPPVDAVGRSSGPGGASSTGAAGGSASRPQPLGDCRLHEQLAALAAQPGWWCLPAVRVSRVYLIQSPLLVRPGPRLVDGVELLARLLMPAHYSSSRKVPVGAVMRLSLAAGQRCRATLLPSYFVPVSFS